MIAVAKPRRPRLFHGWWIVAAGFLTQMLGGGLYFHSFGAYFVYLQADFGWSRTVISGAFSFARLEGGMVGPLQGWMINRFGARNVIRIGTIAFAGGFLWMSRVDSVLEFYAAIFVLAIGSGLGGFLTINIVLANWFEKHRARAMALSGSGASVAGLLVPAVAWALEAFGWRTTAMISAAVVLCIGLPMAQFVRQAPEPYGLLPDGASEAPPRSGGSESRPSASPAVSAGTTSRQALRSPAFWLLSGGHSAALVAVSAVMAHLIPYLVQQVHMSIEAAAGIVASLTLLQIVGNFIAGFLGDRLDKRLICMACMVLHTAAVLVLAFATSPVQILVFAGLHGLAWGTRGPLMSAIRADYFGRRSFATIEGFAALVTMVGLVIGPLAVGVIADQVGDYRPGFVVLSFITAAGFVFFSLARRPSTAQ